jgi:uncharacterized protein involved in type VI secretion and phage assembly
MTFDNLFDRLTSNGERNEPQAPQFGLAFAEVTGVSDEGYILQYLSGNQQAASAPARVASFMAGNGRGAFFMPEVGDEVVVGFELGDVDRPVILGALWSDVDAPPPGVDASASNNVRTITSRAGHQVTFDDSPAGKITIKTHGGLEITLEDGPSPKINIKSISSGPVVIGASKIVLDGVAWNHQHATGTGPSGPPLSIVPVL